ncbi:MULTISPECIES: ATP-binding protein [unclassified Helicobacter]|uniref:ATP-binding protein n=1 Tax=unclassified Helicobacter TaxID=2593540 RepID=UPI0013150513|nr:MULTISPECIES: ATP-binding protein [unclassified Helicobacter]
MLFIDTILPSYEANDIKIVEDFAKKFNYQIITQVPEKLEILYSRDYRDIKIKIFKNNNCIGALMYYQNRSLIATKSNRLGFWDHYGVQLLFLPIIGSILFLAFLFLHAISKITKINHQVLEITTGRYSFTPQKNNRDEIENLNRNLKKVNDAIIKILKGRELVLRSLGHELKTPLAKMKLFLGLKKIRDEDDIKMQKYVNELQEISENILELERINSGNIILEQNNFLSETLLLETLNSFEEEQEKVFFEIKENYLIKSDLRLLVVVLKNLIQNGLKYSDDNKVYIECSKNLLTIKNKGEALKHDITYYLEPFYRDDSHYSITGHGLGLSITSEIIKILKLGLEYKYADGYHHFIINLESKELG